LKNSQGASKIDFYSSLFKVFFWIFSKESFSFLQRKMQNLFFLFLLTLSDPSSCVGTTRRKKRKRWRVMEARYEIMRFKVILVSAIAACFWQAGHAFVPHAPISVRNFRSIQARAARRGHDALHGLLMRVESEGVVPQSESAEQSCTMPRRSASNSAWLKRKMLAGAALLTGKKLSETHFANSNLMSEIAGQLTLQEFAVSLSSPPPSRASDALAKDTGLPSRFISSPDFSIKRPE